MIVDQIFDNADAVVDVASLYVLQADSRADDVTFTMVDERGGDAVTTGYNAASTVPDATNTTPIRFKFTADTDPYLRWAV